MRKQILTATLGIFLASLPAGAGTRPNNDLSRIPRFEDALAHANVTGRPIFLIGYTYIGGGAESFW